MSKITYAPTQELIIHEIVELDKDSLLRERVLPQGTMPLYWCDGIMFSFSSLPMTDEIVSDYLKGRIHWLEVHYTRMPDYQSIMQLSEEEYGQRMKIRVIDTSISQLHKEFIKWLKAYTKR